MSDNITVGRTREEVLRELDDVRAKLAKAKRRRDADAIAYAATPDGAAETFRRFELAQDAAERKQLKSTYLTGLTMAAEEYEQRLARGNDSPADGPLAVIPVGPLSDPVTKVLVTQRIMGTFRSSAASLDTHTVTVTLLRLLPDGQTRKRARIDTIAELGTLTADLVEVIVAAWADTGTRNRLRGQFLDLGIADELAAAIDARSSRQ